jgi:hypothetical protein
LLAVHAGRESCSLGSREKVFFTDGQEEYDCSLRSRETMSFADAQGANARCTVATLRKSMIARYARKRPWPLRSFARSLALLLSPLTRIPDQQHLHEKIIMWSHHDNGTALTCQSLKVQSVEISRSKSFLMTPMRPRVDEQWRSRLCLRDEEVVRMEVMLVMLFQVD